MGGNQPPPGPGQGGAGGGDMQWQTDVFRTSLIRKLEEAIKESGSQSERNAHELERQVFQKANSSFPRSGSPPATPRPAFTGPYMFLVGVGTFLASKEFFVMEHDFYVGLGLAAVLTLVVKQVGPDWTAEINKELDEEEANLRAIRQNEIDAIKTEIALEKESQLDAAAYTDIIAAKKEAVGLQLEASYRARLVEAHSAVKKRLDYQLETANVLRRMEQKHMVDWIISNVKKSITPAQEDAALKKCIADLKKLSAA